MMRRESILRLFPLVVATALLLTLSKAQADSPLQLGTPASFSLDSGQLVSNVFVDLDGTAQRFEVHTNGNGGDLDLFIRFGTPFPEDGLSIDLLNRYAHFHSISSGSNEGVIVLPSSRVPLQSGRWYIDIVNSCNHNVPGASADCVAHSTSNGTVTASASNTAQLGTIHLDFGNPSSDANAPCDDAFWNDSTAATPIGGNTATTLGQQRQNALAYAANQLVQQLQIPVDITVHACGAHLGGDNNSAILAHASPLTYLFDDPQFPINSLPKKYTWYSITSAVRLAGTSSCGLGGGDCNGVDNEEIEAVFNEDIGSSNIVGGEKFYLGFDPAANPGHALDFVTIAMHEMTHGLGFFGLVNLDPAEGPIGAKAGISNGSIAFHDFDLGPFDDIYDDSIAIVNGSAYTPFLGYELNGANDPSRAAALTSGPVITQAGQYNPGTQTALRWSDPVAASASVNTNAAKAAPDNFPSLYAPCDESGSSSCQPQQASTLSHTIQPNDMMNAFYSGFNLRSMGLAVPMLAPLGWSTAAAPTPAWGQTIPGNWYDTAHSGQGFDFQVIAHDAQGRDVYFLTFYTYDANGAPEWYQALGSLVDGVFLPGLQSNGQSLYRLVYTSDALGQITFHADSVTGSVVVDFNQASQSPACRNKDRRGADGSLPMLGVMSWTIGNDSAQWCVQPIVQLADHATPDLNGHWYANNDGGWGFELLDIRTPQNLGASVIVAYVYYPGANGKPTWATASGTLVGNTVTMPLLQVSNGYCRTCPPPTGGLTGTPVGSMTLSFSTPAGGRPSGMASITANYAGGSFSRSNDPIVPLSISTGP